jgi:hypothetical protein
MLQNADTEGIWDARMLARVAEFVVTVEEHSIEPEPHKSLVHVLRFGVPEANRIHCLSLNMDKFQRIVWLKYNRRAMKAQGEIDPSSDPLKRWRIDNTTLTWKDTTTANADQISPQSSGGQLLPFTTPPWEIEHLLNVKETIHDPGPRRHVVEIISDYRAAGVKICRDRARVLVYNLPLPPNQLKNRLRSGKLRTHTRNRTQPSIIHYAGKNSIALYQNIRLE